MTYRTSPLAVATIAPRTTWTRLLRAWWRGTLRKMQLRRDGWCAACRKGDCCTERFARPWPMPPPNCRCMRVRALLPTWQLAKVGGRLVWRHQARGDE
jgi:hypothetical protein